MNITLEQAERAFAQWWKDYLDNPDEFSGDPDLDGRSSAEFFFAYVVKTSPEGGAA
jgi:hypothetical protein